MNRGLKIIWLVGSITIFLWLFFLLRQTFFFHDEWTFLYKIVNSPVNFLLTPHNEHFMPIFNLIYFIEFKLFGFNYGYFQLVLLLLHFAVAYILYLISKEITGNEGLSVAAYFFFLLNSIYWEVIFSTSTLPTILCLAFMGLSIFYFLRYQKRRKEIFLYASAALALFSGYAWGAGLFFPVLFLILVFFNKGSKKTIIKEAGLFVSVQALNLIVYHYLGSGSRFSMNFGKVFNFFVSAVRWLVISFYTSSPGFNKVFLIVGVVLVFVFLPPLFNQSLRQKIFRYLKSKTGIGLFCGAVFFYIYLLSALSRYKIDMALAKSSRYTYIPLFFLILINLIFLSSFWNLLSKLKKYFLIIYLVLLSLGNVYFFNVYYKSWMETISRPNEEIFWKIAHSKTQKELESIKFPSTFHDFYTSEEIYLIYKKSFPQK